MRDVVLEFLKIDTHPIDGHGFDRAERQHGSGAQR